MKNGLTPCLMTTAKTPWLCILLYLVLSDTGTTVHVVNSLCFPARKGLSDFQKPQSEGSDSQETLNIHVYQQTSPFCRGKKCTAWRAHQFYLISRIWRRLWLTRLVATVTNLPCCEADRGPPLPPLHTKGALQLSQYSRGLTSRLEPPEQLGSSSELLNVSTPGFQCWQTRFSFGRLTDNS